MSPEDRRERRNFILTLLSLAVTAGALFTTVWQGWIARTQLLEQQTASLRPAVLASGEASVRIDTAADSLRITFQPTLFNHGSGPAYNVRLYLASQVPLLNHEARSKEEVFASLGACKDVFIKHGVSNSFALVIGNGLSHSIDFVHEASGASGRLPSGQHIRYRAYFLCLYEDVAGNEGASVFSISVEAATDKLSEARVRLDDVSLVVDPRKSKRW